MVRGWAFPDHGPAKHTDQSRHLFIPVRTPNTSKGFYAAASMADAADSWHYMQSFYVPDDFVSLIHLHAVVIAEGTGNLFAAYSAAVGTDGEAFDGDTDVKLASAHACVDDAIEFLADCGEILSTVAAGDVVGIQLFADRDDVLDTINGETVYLLGMIFEYMGEQ